jgi:hypothetical protein
LNAEARLRVTHEQSEPGLPLTSEKQYQGLDQIVKKLSIFLNRPSPTLGWALSPPSGTPSDVINGAPYH